MVSIRSTSKLQWKGWYEGHSNYPIAFRYKSSDEKGIIWNVFGFRTNQKFESLIELVCMLSSPRLIYLQQITSNSTNFGVARGYTEGVFYSENSVRKTICVWALVPIQFENTRYMDKLSYIETVLFIYFNNSMLKQFISIMLRKVVSIYIITDRLLEIPMLFFLKEKSHFRMT